MRFLIHGNSPTAGTGYGIQIGHLARALKADGHEVACSSTWGEQGGTRIWDDDIRVYGSRFDSNGNDSLHMYAEHFFGDQPGWIITCMDVWVLKNPLLAEHNVAAWVPVDHWPLQTNVREFFQMSGAVPVAMSKFGADALADLDPVYVPLSVDTEVFRPVADISGTSPREMCGLPEDAFVVGIVAMNKGWAKDRKGFNVAFRAFGVFERTHPDAYLYVHSEKWGGAEGQNLEMLRVHAGIPEHKLIWSGGPGQLGLAFGYTPPMMATVYSALDVLLAPSHGEGFCVPLIEAQACGTPVIATDFSAQRELVGAGWVVAWQSEYDPAHQSDYAQPIIANPISQAWFDGIETLLEHVDDDRAGLAVEAITELREHMGLGVLDALECAYDVDRTVLKAQAIEFAQDYDTKRVYDEYWRPFIASLTAEPDRPDIEREPMPDDNAVAVLCPVLNRPENVKPLVESFAATTERGEAQLYFIRDDDDDAEIEAIHQAMDADLPCYGIRASRGSSYAQKLNAGLANTNQPWVLCIGDDVRFHEGWLDHARKLSSEFDVIGTNDTAGKVKNPKVANGTHADHFFVRRAYVDEVGATLDGPGVLAPEAYHHWFVDLEIVKLAKARGVFSPCLDAVVEHLHPGYDGDETARRADPTYMAAVKWSEDDAATFASRLPLIEMQRTSRGKL